MTKITLSPVGSLIDTTTAGNTINNNFNTVKTAFDNTLSRDGTQPNQMENNFDMNNFQVLNLPTPATSQSPLRLEDLTSFVGGGTVTNIPTGGSVGQVLSKTSNMDYAVGWKTTEGSVFNITDYGAVGDGVTDNASAINAATTAAGAFAAAFGGGATVYVPQASNSYNIHSPIILPKSVSIVGDFGLSSNILAVDCDAIHLSLPGTPQGQQTIKGLWLTGTAATAARNGIFFGGSLSNNDIIAGLYFGDMYISNFDTAFRLSGVQNVVINNIYAQYINQGCIFTGVVYNTHITNCNFYSIPTLNPSFGSTYTGLSLYTKNYTTLGGILPPEGIFLNNANFYEFLICIDADACDSLFVHQTSLVGLEYGFRFNNVTTVNTFTDNSIEMHGTGAIAGIYGVPLSAPVISHRTIIGNNSLQGVPTGQGTLTTTQCSGIVINGPGGFYQDNVVIQNNYCKYMNIYDISCYNPGANTRIINNYCYSPNATGSIIAGTPVSPYELLVQGNTCYLTIDYANSPTDWPAGTVRSSDNTINNGTSEKSSWNVTSPVARFVTLAGPTAARTYTLPDQSDTVMTTGSIQTITNSKIFNPGQLGLNGSSSGTAALNASATASGIITLPNGPDTLVGRATTDTLTNKTLTSPVLTTPALGTPASGILTNCTGTAAGLTAGNATVSATVTTIGANQVTRANQAQGVARSVIGVTGNATANVADIQGTANQFLGVNSAGTALGFQTMAGDATLSGGAITVTKTNGSVFTAASVALAGQLPATITNDNAATGLLGEYVESVVLTGSAVSLTTATAKTITSISLTAGDWDIDGIVNFNSGLTTNIIKTQGSLSLTTNTVDATPGRDTTMLYNGLATGVADHVSQPIPNYRLSLASTTTVFLVGFANFTISTLTGYGIIRARRVR